MTDQERKGENVTPSQVREQHQAINARLDALDVIVRQRALGIEAQVRVRRKRVSK